MRWLACKTHTLVNHNWSAKKMATAIDQTHDALVEIEKDGKKILDEELMLSIFKPLNLKPLDKYMEFIFEVKKFTMNRNDLSSRHRVKSLGPYIRQELFNPTCKENQATTAMLLGWVQRLCHVS